MESLEVKILDDRPVTHFPKPGQPMIVRAVTYQVGNGIPRVVYIPSDLFSEQKLAEEIRADIKLAAGEGPRTLKL